MDEIKMDYIRAHRTAHLDGFFTDTRTDLSEIHGRPIQGPTDGLFRVLWTSPSLDVILPVLFSYESTNYDWNENLMSRTDPKQR